MRASHLHRFAAVLLLLLTATAMIACDLAEAQAGCDPDGANPGDGCLCCCSHIVVVSPIALAPVARVEFLPPPAEPLRDSVASLPLDHPPRA